MALTLPVRMSRWITDVAQVQAIATAYAMIDPTASFDDITAFLDNWLSRWKPAPMARSSVRT